MAINYADLLASLAIMWKGMLGLFGVCGFVMLLIMLISKFTVNKEKKEN